MCSFPVGRMPAMMRLRAFAAGLAAVEESVTGRSLLIVERKARCARLLAAHTCAPRRIELRSSFSERRRAAHRKCDDIAGALDRVEQRIALRALCRDRRGEHATCAAHRRSAPLCADVDDAAPIREDVEARAAGQMTAF